MLHASVFTLSENELASLLCNIQKKGKLKESLFYIWDEPAYMEDYEQIKRKVNIIRKYASDARILTTFFVVPETVHVKEICMQCSTI